VDEPRTHYQISLTARQAVGLFAGLLLALGVAFALGLVAGMSGRGPVAAGEGVAPDGAAGPAAVRTPPAASEVIPLVETGVPLPSSSGPSRTELAPGIATPVPAEPTTPATLQAFEDGTAEDAAASSNPASARAAPAPGAVAGKPVPSSKTVAALPSSGRIFIQAASLQSREEANSLSARLSKHGFHTVILAVSGPKGKVFRVRVGPYRTDDEASRAVARLAKQEKIREPWIVPEGK
jgi:cell division septation protein DedD